MDEWKNWALWHQSYPKDFKTSPRTALPSQERKQEIALEPRHLSLLQSGELKFLQEPRGRNATPHAVSLGLISIKSAAT